MLEGSRDKLRKPAEDVPRLEKYIGFFNDELQRLRGEAQQLAGRAEAPKSTDRRYELRQTTRILTREVNGLKEILASLEIAPGLETSVESLEKLPKERTLEGHSTYHADRRILLAGGSNRGCARFVHDSLRTLNGTFLE